MEQMITKVCTKSRIGDIDQVKGIVTLAVNHIGNIDSQGDMSMPGSFDTTIAEDFPRVKWLLNHDTTILLGCPISAEEKDGDLVVTGRINLNKQVGRDVFEDYKLFNEYGKTLEHSVGVTPVKWKMDGKVRQVEQWKLWEYSTLSFLGANPNTRLIDVKSATPGDVMEQIGLLEAALKARYSDERLKGIEEQLGILRKAINGELIVTCPYCGKRFDYNSLPEHTFRQEVIDTVIQRVNGIAHAEARRLVDGMEGDIREDVADIVNSIKSRDLDFTEKSLTDITSYVRCPDCWSRVYRIDTTVKGEDGGESSESQKGHSFFAGFKP